MEQRAERELNTKEEVRNCNAIVNNPLFQMFSTGFDALTTNTSPLGPVAMLVILHSAK